MPRRAAKIAAIVLISLILLVVLALAFTQTSTFRQMAGKFALKRINGLLDAELSVDAIEGNLFNHIDLFDVKLIRRDDTLATMGRLSVNYQVLPILRKHIKLDAIKIDSLDANLIQYSDSSWNFAGLLKPDTLKDTTVTSEGFAYDIALTDLILQNSRLTITTPDTSATMIPREINDIYLQFSASMDSSGQKLKLQDLHFTASEPDLQLEQLAFDVTRNQGQMKINDFIVRTAKNQIQGSGDYDPNLRSGNVEMKAAPLDLSEFAFILPKIKLRVAPQLIVKANLAGDSLRARVNVEESGEGADLDLLAFPFSKALDSTTLGEVAYRLESELHRIDVARWTGDTTFAYTLNGRFDLDGRGVSTKTMVATFNADLSDCLMRGRRVGPAGMRFSYNRGNLTGDMIVNGVFGALNFDAVAVDLLNTQKYYLSFTTKKLDLGQLLNNEKLRSSLNLTIVANGSGFSMAKAQGSVSMAIDTSVIYDMPLDGGIIKASFAPDDYIVDTAFVAGSYGTLNLGGDFGRNSRQGLNYNINIGDLTRLKKLLKTDALGGAVTLAGALTGRVDSLAANGQLNFSQILYNKIMLDSGIVDYHALKVGSHQSATAQVRLDSLAFGQTRLETVSSGINFTDTLISLAADIKGGPLKQTRIETDLNLGKTITSRIKNIQFELGQKHWSGGSDSTIVRISDGAYRISNLELQGDSDLNKPRQRIGLEGQFSLKGTENLRLVLDAVEIDGLSDLMAGRYQTAGILNGDILLAGAAAEPLLNGRVDLQDAKLNRFRFDSLTSTFAYKDERLTWDALLAAPDQGSVSAQGFVPMHLSFAATPSDTGQIIIGDKPMEIHVLIDRLPFSVIEAANNEIQDTKGVINGEAHFVNTYNKPGMSGKVAINQGGFEYSKTGVKYSDLEMAMSLNNNIIRLDSLFARRGDGFMRVVGEMEFDSSLASGSLRRSDFDLRADRLFLVRNQDIEIQISGHVNAEGSSRVPSFGGRITVDRSRLYIPLLSSQAMAGASRFEKAPLLVVATRPETTAVDSASAAVERARQAQMKNSLDYFKNLRGNVAISIPHNTWLRSPDMNIEIAGDIELVKNSPDLYEIFGPIRVVRGKYTLYGKQFRITEGQLVFTGGKDYNPDIDMSAEYVFRSPEREKRIITLHITGKAQQPQLAFMLDGSEITQSDAVAYVVFGRSMEDVTGAGIGLAGRGDGNGGNSGGETELAKSVAAKLVAGQLAKTLGQQLALDVVDVKASETLRGATVSVGKYITSNLFMSYQRGIGQVTETETTPAITTLEYEIARFLSVQLAEGDPEKSGIDLLFKFKID